MTRNPTRPAWFRRLLVGASVMAIVAIIAPPGVAGAAAQASSTAPGVVAQDPDPGGGDGGSQDPDPGGGNADPDPDPGTGNGGNEDPKPDPEPDPDPVPDPEPQPDPQTAAPEPTGPTPEEQAAKEAAKEAERQRKAAERAAREAARFAAAAAKVRNTWNTRGRPQRMLILRPSRVDVVNNGSLSSEVPRSVGPVTMTSLARHVPGQFLSIAGDTANLAATIVMTPGVTLELGGDVKNVKLAGGPAAPDAASIYIGSARLNLRGVNVSSSDPGFQQPMAASAGRPFILVSPKGTLDAVDSTVSDLGTVPNDAVNRAGVQFNRGSKGSLVRTSLARNSTGLKLTASEGVRLEDVTVSDSSSNGVILAGDIGTQIKGLKAERNKLTGVLVTGPVTPRPITGISTKENGGFGVGVSGQHDLTITGITTDSDKAGGVRVGRSNNMTVSDITAINEPLGVYTHVGSTNVTFDKIKIEGGRRGVVIEKSTKQVKLTNSTISGSRVSGVAVGGHDVDVENVTVSDARSAMRVERGSGNITTTGLTIAGGRDGFVSSAGASNVVVKDLISDGVEGAAIRSSSPDAQIIGGKISGGTTGVVASAATTIEGTWINNSHEGLRVRSPDPVKATRVDVATTGPGVNVAPGSPFTLVDSRVQAIEAVRGTLSFAGVNDIALPPLNLLAAVGVPLILLAFVLEQVHTGRQRRFGGLRRQKPPAITVSGD